MTFSIVERYQPQWHLFLVLCGKPKWWRNVWPIEHAARAWIEESIWAPVPSDKEGGFVMVDFHDLRDSQLELLSGPWYKELGPGVLSAGFWSNSLVPAYRNILQEIVKVDSRVSMRILCGSLSGGLPRACSALMRTVKTHKEPGKVTFRAIRGSSRHAFTGVMSWICLILQDVLKKFRHIIGSSDDCPVICRV